MTPPGRPERGRERARHRVVPGGPAAPPPPDTQVQRRVRRLPGGLTVIPCPLCGILQDSRWMNFHLINGHGFAGGPGLPSPHTNSLVASEGYREGGRGASESASGSPGRPSEKGGQRSVQGQGGAIAPVEVTEAEKTAGLSLTQRQAADLWMKESFFAKKGSPKSVGDEWRNIVAAAKGFGMQQGEVAR